MKYFFEIDKDDKKLKNRSPNYESGNEKIEMAMQNAKMRPNSRKKKILLFKITCHIGFL